MTNRDAFNIRGVLYLFVLILFYIKHSIVVQVNQFYDKRKKTKRNLEKSLADAASVIDVIGISFRIRKPSFKLSFYPCATKTSKQLHRQGTFLTHWPQVFESHFENKSNHVVYGLFALLGI